MNPGEWRLLTARRVDEVSLVTPDTFHIANKGQSFGPVFNVIWDA